MTLQAIGNGIFTTLAITPVIGSVVTSGWDSRIRSAAVRGLESAQAAYGWNKVNARPSECAQYETVESELHDAFAIVDETEWMYPTQLARDVLSIALVATFIGTSTLGIICMTSYAIDAALTSREFYLNNTNHGIAGMFSKVTNPLVSHVDTLSEEVQQQSLDDLRNLRDELFEDLDNDTADHLLALLPYSNTHASALRTKYMILKHTINNDGFDQSSLASMFKSEQDERVFISKIASIATTALLLASGMSGIESALVPVVSTIGASIMHPGDTYHVITRIASNIFPSPYLAA